MKLSSLLDFGAVFNSMAGRIFLLLSIGMLTAASAALILAEQVSRDDFQRLRLDRVVALVSSVHAQFTANPADTMQLLTDDKIIYVRPASEEVAIVNTDANLVRQITQSLGAASAPDAGEVPSSLCFPRRKESLEVAAGINGGQPVSAVLPDCWVVRFNDTTGARRSLAIYLPPLILSSALNSSYLLALLAASAILAILIARFASTPLNRLMQAARAFSVSSDPAKIEEKGPREVRAALATFNLMQSRVREGFKDRTQLLASISHDLQTPLTRLRLRLEQVSDEKLRQRLINDLSATQDLVREGLDLARSTESAEEWSVVDLDSLVASIAEDAAEFGAPVQFTDGCGRNVRVKPNALGRCLNNLIDNAVRYGGDADVSCKAEEGRVVISVRDHGPGLSPESIERMFEPFVRGEADKAKGPGAGTGIGLTIARAQARTSGADVRLRNHPEGGLVAEIELAV